MTLHQDAIETLNSFIPTPQARQDWNDTVELLKRGPQVLWREHDGAHVTGSAIVVSPDRKRFLLCLHGKFNVWVQLGGHCEEGDTTLAGVALREATEESGITGLTVDPMPIDIDIHKVRCAGRECLHHDVIFVVYAPENAVEQVSEESHALGWFSADDLPAPLGTDTDRVIRSAVTRVQLA